MIFMKTTLNIIYKIYRKHCPCSGNRSFVYSVVPSPMGQREKKAMTDLEYEVSLVLTVSLSPSSPFSVSQQAGRGSIKIFALSVQNNRFDTIPC